MTGEQSLQYQLTRVDTQIRVEFDLVSHRMTWLTISQSFLFNAYVASFSPLAVDKFPVLENLHWLLPSLGFTLAILVAGAIHAAHSVIKELKKIANHSKRKRKPNTIIHPSGSHNQPFNIGWVIFQPHCCRG